MAISSRWSGLKQSSLRQRLRLVLAKHRPDTGSGPRKKAGGGGEKRRMWLGLRKFSLNLP
ncbi:MAG TPA: hypothetical protein VG839_05870 [Asticcacaulis sp.]|nr:hypothetical protein [Asticcacaulis sp.]